MESTRIVMNPEPRHQNEYTARQTEAAHRVLVDLGQVLASFQNCLVLIGGWVPDLLLTNADEPHIGSIDVDLALDAEKLSDGRYAELIQLLINTRRYQQSEEAYKLYSDVNLGDGEPVIRVDVDFLKSPEVKTKKNNPKLTDGFRPLDAAGCETAFEHPELIVVTGKMIQGAENQVKFRVASLANFLVMKSYALEKRDKPKDAYDICYCLDHYPNGMEKLADSWNERRSNKHIINSIEILKEKFQSVDSFGPYQVVEFYNSQDIKERERQARRAFELVQKFLKLVNQT